MPPTYAWFASGIGASALAAGMHQVLFSWLVLGELRGGAAWMGAAQTCQMLPALLLLLIGGATADRVDRRRLLLVLQGAAAVAAAAMGAVVQMGVVTLAIVLAYALSWGVIQTFAQPARDAWLSDVAGEDLMRAVTGVTLVQFAGQAVGARLAGIAAWIGNAPALGVQAGLLLLGLVPFARLPAPPAHASHESGATLTGIWAGLREVLHSATLRPIALLVAADGLFFMGPFFVLSPLMVRDLYGGTVAELSLAMMSFTAGTIIGSGSVLLRGGVRRKGRAFLLALLGVSLCLLVMALRPPFWGFVLALFGWGVAHSLFFNTSRMLFQRAASARHRARVLSVHSLGLLGMAPFSNLGAGALAGYAGPLAGCAVGGGAMLLLTGAAWSFTSVRRLE